MQYKLMLPAQVVVTTAVAIIVFYNEAREREARVFFVFVL